VVTAARAIQDGIDAHLAPHLVRQAIETAQARGLLTRDEHRRIDQRLPDTA